MRDAIYFLIPIPILFAGAIFGAMDTPDPSAPVKTVDTAETTTTTATMPEPPTSVPERAQTPPTTVQTAPAAPTPTHDHHDGARRRPRMHLPQRRRPMRRVVRRQRTRPRHRRIRPLMRTRRDPPPRLSEGLTTMSFANDTRVRARRGYLADKLAVALVAGILIAILILLAGLSVWAWRSALS